jgi:probable HAF family extracellular repeat protein
MPVYTYTSLDDPFALSGTQAMGINATGQIVGSYSNHGGSHGFLYSSGTYTILDDPLANQGTAASGVNAAGMMVALTPSIATATVSSTTPAHLRTPLSTIH